MHATIDSQLEAIQLHLGLMPSIRNRPGGGEATELLGKTRDFRCLLKAERPAALSARVPGYNGEAHVGHSPTVPQLEAVDGFAIANVADGGCDRTNATIHSRS